MADLSGVDWQQVGIAAGTAVAAAGAALTGMRRMWNKGLGELLRPVVQREVRKAGKGLAEDLRAAVREAMADLREDHETLAQDVDDLKERMTKVERAVAPPPSTRRDNQPS